ncbi:MAG: TraB/GumN family protein [Candidatus Nanohaloarchaea archaeon]
MEETALIHVYGVSHVSRESMELMKEKIEEHGPEVVALELDATRFNALISDEQRNQGPIFLKLVQKFQRYIGSKTGVMPGEEMMYAYDLAAEKGMDVALIDQDIRVTVHRLKDVRRKEKVRAAFQLLLAPFLPGSFDFSEIPGEEFIDEILEEMKDEFPGLYTVLVEERNAYMAEALRQTHADVKGDVVAFVGAAHRDALKEMLDEVDS